MSYVTGRGTRLYLGTDVEAIPDPAIPLPKKKNGAKTTASLPAPPHWQVVCVGYCWVEFRPSWELRPASVPEWVIGWDVGWGFPEPELLRQFWQMVEQVTPEPTLVTYAGRSFDLPVLTARSFRHGVRAPWYYSLAGGLRNSPRYRYSDERHIDLCEGLSDYGAGKRAGLAAWARCCGWPGKTDVDGSMVEAMVKRGEIEQVANYCLSDVGMTIAVLLRWLLLTGKLDDPRPENQAEIEARAVATYRVAAHLLLDMVRGDARTAAYGAKVIEHEFLLHSADDPYERET